MNTITGRSVPGAPSVYHAYQHGRTRVHVSDLCRLGQHSLCSGATTIRRVTG